MASARARSRAGELARPGERGDHRRVAADLRPLAALALGLASCTGPAARPGEDVPGPEAAPRVAPPARRDAARPEAGELQAVMQGLAAGAVRHDAPVRKVLYTWTTREQSEELRARQVLLTREAREDGSRARFDLAVAEAGGPVAVLLAEPGRRARRFAWPLPWATVMGWDGEGYGPDLVRVELRAAAIVGRFTPGEPWRFFDGEGREVAEAEVLAAPERLAAVYHVAPPRGDAPGFREYVLVQEAMIASWSLGTAEIRAELGAGAALLAGAADKIDASRALAAARCASEGARDCAAVELPEETEEIAAWSGRLIAGPWAAGPPAADVLLADLYAACLAIPGRPYAPTGAGLRALARRLDERAAQPPPLVVEPDPEVIREAKAGTSPRVRAEPPRRPPDRPCRDPSMVCPEPRRR